MLSCEDKILARGLEVAADEDGVTLLGHTYSTFEPGLWLLDVHEGVFGLADLSGGAQFVDSLLGQAPDGSLAVAATEYGAGPSHDGFYVEPGAEGWVGEALGNESSFLENLELDGEGRPFVWYRTFGEDSAYYRMSRDSQGEWSEVEVPATGSGARGSLDYDGGPMRYEFRDSDGMRQLYEVREGELEASVGSPVAADSQVVIAMRPGEGSAPEGREAGRVAIVRPGQNALVVDRDGTQIELSGTTPISDYGSCNSSNSCEGTCTESDEGMVFDGLALADVADGSTWVAWVYSVRSQTFEYSLSECEESECCLSTLIEDVSTRRAEIVRIGPEGEQTPVLSLELGDGPPPEYGGGGHNGPISLRAYGDRMAVGINATSETHLLELDIQP